MLFSKKSLTAASRLVPTVLIAVVSLKAFLRLSSFKKKEMAAYTGGGVGK